MELLIKDLWDIDFKITMANMLKKITDELGDFSRELKAIKTKCKIYNWKKSTIFKIEKSMAGFNSRLDTVEERINWDMTLQQNRWKLEEWDVKMLKLNNCQWEY